VELLLPLLVFRLTGMSADAAAIAVMIQGLQGVFGHTNLDLRFGPVNYVLMTTETHRYHHSAMPQDFGNFGSTTSVWDQVFGTFVYNPKRVPARLGLSEGAVYPNPERYHATLAWPFLPATSAAS
jgi:sterol desaturase/sphingolipid hydroxylase (fatty acid hydroxylase superfamily)